MRLQPKTRDLLSFGKKRFGLWRFVPFFFLAGAGIELLMVKWDVGGINFYSVYKRKEVARLAPSLVKGKEVDGEKADIKKQLLKDFYQGKEQNSS